MNRFPPYLRQIIENAKDVRPGEVVLVEVQHDDWCAIYKGRVCDCEPDVDGEGSLGCPRCLKIVEVV